MSKIIKRFKSAFVISFITSWILSCAILTKSIPINYVRIENAKVESLFQQETKVQNIRALWRGNTLEILYDFSETSISQNGSFTMSYYSDDGNVFKSNIGDGLSTTGSILSLDKNTEVVWEDVKNVENLNNDNLILVLWAQDNDDVYKDMVLIQGGSFKMGSKLKKDEKPIHRVSIKSYYMDKYEVTVGQFQEFCRATGKRMPKQPYWNGSKHPVVNVSWNAAKLYAKWKKKRLPTEAEWEYAARSGAKGYYYAWGNKNPFKKNGGNIADEAILIEKQNWRIWKNYYDGYVYTAPVGSFNSNEFGLHDMTGNVWEWCSDWYAPDYYKNSPAENPPGPNKGTHRILRGGSWNFDPRGVLATKRLNYRPDVTLDYVGFRCVKDL